MKKSDGKVAIVALEISEEEVTKNKMLREMVDANFTTIGDVANSPRMC